MQITKHEQRATSTQRYSKASEVEVPQDYSRQKAIQLAKRNGGNAIPQSGARQIIFMMLVKLGATSELPQKKEYREGFLNDFWRVMYFENNYCPGDIPFPIIMDAFVTAVVQGRADRKGNNQAAICQAFNKWVTRDDVRHKLYQKRDQMYPHKKPKQLAKNATPETIRDYSDEELRKKLTDIKPMAGIAMVDRMIQELEGEIERRE